MSDQGICDSHLPTKWFVYQKLKHNLQEIGADSMKNMTVFKGTIISCSVVAISFALCVYFMVGDYSKSMTIDMIRVFWVLEGGGMFASGVMPLLFRGKWRWHWPMLIIAIPVQIVFTILIIVVVF